MVKSNGCFQCFYSTESLATNLVTGLFYLATGIRRQDLVSLMSIMRIYCKAAAQGIPLSSVPILLLHLSIRWSCEFWLKKCRAFAEQLVALATAVIYCSRCRSDPIYAGSERHHGDLIYRSRNIRSHKSPLLVILRVSWYIPFLTYRLRTGHVHGERVYVLNSSCQR